MKNTTAAHSFLSPFFMEIFFVPFLGYVWDYLNQFYLLNSITV